MRQKRKSVIVRPIKWLILLLFVGIASVSGLTAAGLIQWKAEITLERLMFWQAGKASGETAGQAGDAGASRQPDNTAGSGSGSGSGAKTAGASAAPASPPAKPVENPGFQLLSQAQSLVSVSANERAWLELAGTIRLEPKRLFSYNAWFNEAAKAKSPEMKEDELSHIAGLLYEAAIRVGMKAGERHPHQDIPAYAAAGFDVEFQPNQKDLTLYNPFDFAVTVGVVYNGDTPTLTFNGTPSASWKAPKVLVNKESFAPDKIVLTDFALAGKGEVKRSDGTSGLLVKVYADWKNDGKNELLYKDFYAPHPVVIARSPSAEELKAIEVR